MKTRTTTKRFSDRIAASMKKEKGFRAFGKRNKNEELTPAQSSRLMALLAELRQPAKPMLATRGPERRMVRGDIFSASFERQLLDAATALGVSLQKLNDDQKRLLVSMAMQPLSNNQRRRMLADAE